MRLCGYVRHPRYVEFDDLVVNAPVAPPKYGGPTLPGLSELPTHPTDIADSIGAGWSALATSPSQGG
jgi:hypothetical protein